MNPNPLARLGFVIVVITVGSLLMLGTQSVMAAYEGFKDTPFRDDPSDFIAYTVTTNCGSLISPAPLFTATYPTTNRETTNINLRCEDELDNRKNLMLLVGFDGLILGLGMIWAGGGLKAKKPPSA